MTDFHGDDMLNEEAFIATSFIQFHTEDPGDGSYIPMTEDEASQRWSTWLAEYTRQQREEAFALGVDYQWKHRPMGNRTAWNPYREGAS